MDKVQIAKTSARWIVAIGTGRIIYGIINHTTPREELNQKITAGVAGFVMGGMASEAAGEWTDRKIDAFVAEWRELKNA